MAEERDLARLALPAVLVGGDHADADNVPVVSWLALRGGVSELRTADLRLACTRSIELLVGLLFAAVYVTDVAFGRPIPWGALPVVIPVGLAYHLVLVALLVAATFIDYDLMIIPDEVTIPGMAIGLAVATVFPDVRPLPSSGTTHWDGFRMGVVGLLVGGGLTQGGPAVRFGSDARREAMGLGDVTLMAMIGAFLGWQAAVLTFFLAPFFGLSRTCSGNSSRSSASGSRDTRRRAACPTGSCRSRPYLSMAAARLAALLAVALAVLGNEDVRRPSPWSSASSA